MSGLIYLAMMRLEFRWTQAALASAHMVAVRGPASSVPGRRLLRGIAQLAPYGLVLIGYLAIRSGVSSSSPTMGAARYDFHLGKNVPQNMALLLFAGVLPASTVKSFRAYQGGQRAEAGLAALWEPERTLRSRVVGFLVVLLLSGVPPGGRLDLINPSELEGGGYSVFLMQGSSPVSEGSGGLGR